jgi:integrase
MGVKLYPREGKRGVRWWVRIYHDGKERTRSLKTGDEKRASEIAKKLEAKLILGELKLLEEEPPAAPARPFDAYFTNWLETYARSHCKDSTFAGYQAAFELYLRPTFGSRDLADITRADVKQLAFDLLAGRLPGTPEKRPNGKERHRRASKKSRSYVKGTLAPLSEMFNHAIEDGDFEGTNPALRVLRRIRSDDAGAERSGDFLTGPEAGRLLAACREHFPRWHPFVLCLTHTGLRIGEAIALQWGDVDFSGRFISVKRNLVDGKLTTPKSGKGRRVDLSGELASVLRALQVDGKREKLRLGRPALPPWLFTNDEGNAIDPDNFRKRVWPKLLEKAKLRAIRIHDVRHTYASLLIQQGESLAYVKEQMGHQSIRVTVDTYGHLVPGGNSAAADRLAALLSRAPICSSGPEEALTGTDDPAATVQNRVTEDRQPRKLVEPKGVEPSTSRVRF